jgi:DNA-binding IclR family transcriptional regulator
MEKTFLKGLTLLERLAGSSGPRGVTELANELGMTKSNVHRLLNTLVHAGYVRKHATAGTYSCTLKLWEIATPIITGLEVKAIAANFLRDLANRTQETVHLSILDEDSVIYIDKIDSPQPVRAYSEIGGRAPAHCVATGKALLAFQKGKAGGLSASKLVRHTERTIVDPEDFERELRRIREVGYALNRGEWRISVGGVAAPIFDATQTACAAVGVSGPIERLTLTAMQDIAPRVTEVASAITRQLGGNWRLLVYGASS